MTIQEEQNKVEYNLDRADVVMDYTYINDVDMASKAQAIWWNCIGNQKVDSRYVWTHAWLYREVRRRA